MPDSISSCGVLEAPPARITSWRAAAGKGGVGEGGRGPTRGDRRRGRGRVGRAPAAPAMPGGVPAEQPVEPAEEEPAIAAAPQPAEILLHVGGPPRGIAGQLPDVV